MEPRPKKPAALPNLTALRLLTAALVLFFHLTEDHQFNSVPWMVRPILHQGFTGVSVFFVLSGFVLAYNHLEVRSKASFYLARIARIYPLYLFALAWIVAYRLTGAHMINDSHVPLPLVTLASIFAVQTWFPRIALDLNAPGWTISVEAFFYLLFPFLMKLVLPRLEKRWRWMVGIWILFLVPTLLVNYWSVWFGVTFSQHTDFLLHAPLLTPLFRVGEFTLGIFAGARFRKHPTVTSGWSVLAASAICIAAIYLSNYLPHEVVRDDVMALLYTWFIILLAGWKSPFLETWPWQLGGEISFGIYLLQFPLMETMNALFRRFLPTHNYKYPLLLVLPVLSFITYTCIEKPARKAILKRFGVRAAPKPLPTPATIP